MAASKLLIGIISGTIIAGSAVATFQAQSPAKASVAPTARQTSSQAAVAAESSADSSNSDAKTTRPIKSVSSAAAETQNDTPSEPEETVSLNGWSDGKYFIDNVPVSNAWEVIDGQTYRFDADGNEVTGWYSENGNTYYLGTDGTLTIGNASIDGKNYYFNENGAMQTGWIDGNYYNTDGTEYSFDGTLGNVGRLFIPSVGVNVALNYVDDNTGDEAAQAICDAEDSAAYMNFSSSDEVWIGDHNFQGFDAIKSVVPGTEAYIKNTDGTITTYTCTEITQATNTGYDLVTADGRSASNINAGGIIMYTCNDDWTSVTATFWQPK
ncbi:MAG: hypothetical protein PUG18_09050 [Lachnospiraceae bacterium]|nr:hypothetical protein [Lachnospiraceae bacterium]